MSGQRNQVSEASLDKPYGTNLPLIESWGWRDPAPLTLTDGHYRCPKCGEFELRFGTNVGCHPKVDWD